MVGSPIAIEGGISQVWAEAFLRSMGRGNGEYGPLTASVTQFDDNMPIEIPAIRNRLDNELRAHGFAGGSETIANTIFPTSMWNPNVADDVEQLFDRYDRVWPHIHRHTANKRGTYFRRLTAYAPKDGTGHPINQLRHIIDTYRKGNHRRSALIASVFDATRDHTDCRRQPFPCMQQISFAPVGTDALIVTAIYVTQYLFPRAYGNYLGLCRLASFMAKHMARRVSRVNCIATIAMRGGDSKAALESLAGDLRRVLASTVEETRGEG